MTKFKRIINGDCHYQMIELFDDAEKAANLKNNGEFVECKIQNLRIDFTKVTKEHDGRHQDARIHQGRVQAGRCVKDHHRAPAPQVPGNGSCRSPRCRDRQERRRHRNPAQEAGRDDRK